MAKLQRVFAFCIIAMLLAVEFVLPARAAGEACVTSSDCAGFHPGAVCHTEQCLAGVCADASLVCNDGMYCSDHYHECIECINADECHTGTCNPDTHTCMPCKHDTDCPSGDWCRGGQWACDVESGSCLAPLDSEWPCGHDIKHCHADSKRCDVNPASRHASDLDENADAVVVADENDTGHPILHYMAPIARIWYGQGNEARIASASISDVALVVVLTGIGVVILIILISLWYNSAKTKSRRKRR